MNLELQMTQELSSQTVLEILTGRRKDGEILSPRLAGHAYLPVGSNIYEIKLMMFPRHTYYLRQNQHNSQRYTVFAKRCLENGETKLLNPVGMGRPSAQLTNYIEIYFPLLGRMIFLDLIPKN